MALIQLRCALVLDTNTIVRAFMDWQSPAGVILEMCERREIRLLLSPAVLGEYRTVLAYPRVAQRHPDITPEAVETILRRLRYQADCPPRHVRFEFKRDPDDQKFLELALAGSATHLVTIDNDLLSLQDGHDETANRLRRRLPGLKILRPADFLTSILNSDDSRN